MSGWRRRFVRDVGEERDGDGEVEEAEGEEVVVIGSEGSEGDPPVWGDSGSDGEGEGREGRVLDDEFGDDVEGVFERKDVGGEVEEEFEGDERGGGFGGGREVDRNVIDIADSIEQEYSVLNPDFDVYADFAEKRDRISYNEPVNLSGYSSYGQDPGVERKNSVEKVELDSQFLTDHLASLRMSNDVEPGVARRTMMSAGMMGVRRSEEVERDDVSGPRSSRNGSSVMSKVLEIHKEVSRRDCTAEEFLGTIRNVSTFVILVSCCEEELRMRKSALIRSSFVEAFTFALGRFSSRQEIQEAGCAAILELVRSDSDMRRAFGEADAIQLLTVAIARHMDSASLCDSAIEALLFILHDDSNRDRLAGSTTVDTTVIAMKRHSDDAAVQESACLFFASCAYKHEDNQYTCVVTGAVDAIVDAMRNNLGNLPLQRRGCIALRNISWENPSVKAQVIEKGGLVAVVAALEKYADNEGLVEQGSIALLHMGARASERGCNQLTSEKTMRIILEVMETQVRVESLQKHLLLVLREIMSIEGAPESVIRVGGVKVVIDVIKENVTDPKIMSAGCQVLGIMARTRIGSQILKDNGGPNLLLDFVYMSLNCRPS